MNALPTRACIGLTGGIGSGKSIVAERFVAKGAGLVDTDVLAHQLTAPDGAAIPAIRAHFGNAYIRADGAMDRVRMRETVFADAAARSALEHILHPLIRAAAETQARCTPGAYVLFAVPLLVESPAWQARMDRILVIDCPESLQIARVLARSGLSEATARAIVQAQSTRAARLAIADDVIDNSRDLEALQPQIDALDARYRALGPFAYGQGPRPGPGHSDMR